MVQNADTSPQCVVLTTCAIIHCNKVEEDQGTSRPEKAQSGLVLLPLIWYTGITKKKGDEQ
jgi:hypothetical protein